MNSVIRLVAVVAGLVLMLHVTPSWGQPVCQFPGCNPTVSDANDNTAGGTDALADVVSGRAGGINNTAFGYSRALLQHHRQRQHRLRRATHSQSNTTRQRTTPPVGASALSEQRRPATTIRPAAPRRSPYNTDGSHNAATAFKRSRQQPTGINNTASGANALYTNTTGNNNAASVSNALHTNTTGSMQHRHRHQRALLQRHGQLQHRHGRTGALLST